ncbi:hypothetical protein V5N11_028035 [Cardamine amara subsp. amara]|uniref:Replication protein A 70 kDa DNA-binding subunit B/D first OB fold domain-containing protein n=1 Tax=Cardamine amara subsp. amara TaxID=228776 RepID=A0ABD1AMF8_CARAN
MALYHDLYRLNTSITGWHVRVKMLRIFQVSTFSLGKSLGLILVDEKGEKVEAFVDKAYANYYLEFLEEDSWYTIMKFKVFLNNGPIKLTKSLFNIGFLNDSIVKDCDLLNDCFYATFTPFGAILNGTTDHSYLIELVGYVVKAGELTYVDPQPIELSGYRLSFVLKDKE